MGYDTQFLIIYAGLIAMTLHPGYNRENAERPTFEECVRLAHQAMLAKENP